MLRNIASQKWRVYAWDTTTGLAKTGDAANISAYITVDDGTPAGTDDAAPTEADATNEPGYYDFDLTQAETNGAKLSLSPKSGTSDIQVVACPPVVYTRPQYFSALGIESDGDLTQVNTLAGHTAQTGDSYAYLGTNLGSLGANATEAGGTGDQFTALTTAIADVPTVAEFEARTLEAADYFDPATDAVANVTLVATCTTNTDMRGTDSAATASALATAQADLDTITGSDGVTLATAQANYAPAKAGDNMGTVSAVTGGINTGAGTITTLDALDTAQDTQHNTTQTKVDTAQADLGLLTGTDGATLATSQPNYAPATSTALATAQADLDTITGSDGVTLATAQGNYAPAVAGDEMDLVNAPNATAVTAIQNGLATSSALTTVGSNVTAIKAITDALTAAAAAKLATSAGTIVTGTVSDASTSPTTTVFAADDITEATADHFNGRIIIFTSGALQNQATDITDYALDSGEGKFTCTALTESPANDDTFVIV